MPRGSKPGERRGGRKTGTPNKVTADIRAIAQDYGPSAITVLTEIMQSKEQPPAARVAAAKELLDRGYGKSIQGVALTGALAITRSPHELTDDELAAIAAAGRPGTAD